ncbi:acetyl-CoA acyltransferase [Ferrithrix thermotolerans DSM 19514]|uniref:Beta-ketoadipyl-CoA thiolase n=1 Tax=Ferrithrix thermotolerans DSM 19514 TaxID=1121881 RepID=A0A1M4UHR8_9ACTN|nr:3-oxoadipyl-CoA thiolase [Ferrithrix thermotolerans]SHE56100.1 acetyl-CoA acyltransferase [Ferrithrix thermotolerans DSM 19514]
MSKAYIYDGVRSPFGRYGGSLAHVRSDDLASQVISALVKRNPEVRWSEIDDVYFGCANQAGEDNRNVARMAALLAGLPVTVPAVTYNRLCASSLDAVGSASRAIRSGDLSSVVVGGVESMSRAPFVMPKADAAFSRTNRVEDTTIGWRFINPRFQELYGTDSMPETAENVAKEYHIARRDQDEFALRSQLRYKAAKERGFYKDEITPIEVALRSKEPILVVDDEHPRDTSMEMLGRLKGVVQREGTVTAGNSSGINDGSVAMLIGSDSFGKRNGLVPMAEVVSMTTYGVDPKIMGIGPVGAVRKILSLTGVDLSEIDVIELNEAFAAQAVAVLRELGVSEDSDRVNPNGGAIAIGHPLGASGARIVLTAARQLQEMEGHYALCTMCVGVGQGVAVLLSRP